MTAETAGKAAVAGVWATLRSVRDQWLLVVFLAGALFGIRDAYVRFAELPASVSEQRTEVAELREQVARLNAAVARKNPARTEAVMEFPGNRHRVGDALAGEWTVARLVPTRPLRGDCRTVGVDAWLIDSAGRWFSAETGLRSVPKLTDETDLSFGVRIPGDAAPGRAQLILQLTHDCGSQVQVQAAPRLPFRVIAD